MKRSFFRGHPIIWEGNLDTGRWVYEDNLEPLPSDGGEIRKCKKCGEKTTLGEGEIDPCLGLLPGVDNACCGHGERSESYIRFTTGVVIKNFDVEDLRGINERYNMKSTNLESFPIIKEHYDIPDYFEVVDSIELNIVNELLSKTLKIIQVLQDNKGLFEDFAKESDANTKGDPKRLTEDDWRQFKKVYGQLYG